MALERDEPIPFINAKVVGDNIDPDAYHAQDPDTPRGHPHYVMSRSDLMLFAACPSKWFNGFSPKETDATSWGDLFDCMVTSNEFDKRYVIRPATVTATKTMGCVKDGEAEVGDLVPWRNCKEATDWKRANRGRIPVPTDQFNEAEQARRRLMSDPDLAEFIACSRKQVMVVAEYRDRETGLVIPWKSLIDLVPSTRHERYFNYLGDLKTARNADPRRWHKECDERNYDAQAAANQDAYTAATKERRESFAHVIVENTFPFEPTGGILSLELVGYGRLKIIGALRWYCQCLAANHWPNWREFSQTVFDGFVKIDAGPWHSQLKSDQPLTTVTRTPPAPHDPDDVLP